MKRQRPAFSPKTASPQLVPQNTTLNSLHHLPFYYYSTATNHFQILPPSLPKKMPKRRNYNRRRNKKNHQSNSQQQNEENKKQHSAPPPVNSTPTREASPKLPPPQDPSQDPLLQNLISHYSTTSEQQDLIQEIYYANSCDYFISVKLFNELFAGKNGVEPLQEKKRLITPGKSSATTFKQPRRQKHAPSTDTTTPHLLQQLRNQGKNKKDSAQHSPSLPKATPYLHPKNLKFLQDIFSDLAEPMIRNILLDSNGDLSKATEALLNLSNPEASWNLGEYSYCEVTKSTNPNKSTTKKHIPTSAPSLSTSQKQVVENLVQLFPFITDHEIALLGKKLHWNQSKLWNALEKRQQMMEKGQIPPPIEEEKARQPSNHHNTPTQDQFALDMDFPSLHQETSVGLASSNDLKYIQDCIRRLHRLFRKKMDKEMISQIFIQSNHSFDRAQAALEEMFPGVKVEQRVKPKNIAAQMEKEDGNSAGDAISPPNTVYSKGWQKIKVKKSRPSRSQPSFQNPMDEYEACMESARELAQERIETVRHAIECYKGGQVHNAQRYTADASELRERIKKLQTRAYRLLHSADPDSMDSSVTILDLHGYMVEEAVSLFLKHYTAMHRKNLKQFQCITGKGIHSHRSQAKIRPAIKNLCKQRGIRFLEKRLGILEVECTRRL